MKDLKDLGQRLEQFLKILKNDFLKRIVWNLLWFILKTKEIRTLISSDSLALSFKAFSS